MASIIIEGDPYHIDDLLAELEKRNYLDSATKIEIVNFDATKIEQLVEALQGLLEQVVGEPEYKEHAVISWFAGEPNPFMAAVQKAQAALAAVEPQE